MNADLAFGRDGLTIPLPPGFEYEILRAPDTNALPDAPAAIHDALRNPCAGPSLAAVARGKRTAAISICDITRPAPNPTVLPPLIEALGEAGIPKWQIRILIATGLHRAASDNEIRQIVGPQVYGQIEVLNHDARNESEHRGLGRTRSGTDVWIDERFLKADLHITLGFIEPHLMLGFSGGRKLIAPGLAAERTIKRLHSSFFMRDDRAREGSIHDNPLHAELLEIARMARHDFIIDVALTRDRKISAIFAGEPEGAHARGVKWVSDAMMQRLEQPFDAAITTGAGYPLDLTYYQTIKGVTAASHIVRDGGTILVFGACEEGVGAAEFRDMVARYATDTEFMKAIENAPVTIDQWQLEKLALATQKAHVMFCLPGLDRRYRDILWGPAFDDPNRALHTFFSSLRPGSRVAVIPEGPYVLASVGTPVLA